jgi:hypothetical protein
MEEDIHKDSLGLECLAMSAIRGGRRTYTCRGKMGLELDAMSSPRGGRMT